MGASDAIRLNPRALVGRSKPRMGASDAVRLRPPRSQGRGDIRSERSEGHREPTLAKHPYHYAKAKILLTDRRQDAQKIDTD